MKRAIAALTALVALASPAAAVPYWSAISTACVPDSLSIQGDRYRSPADSFVLHQVGSVDPVVLICGVAPNPGGQAPNAVSMTYLDGTGEATTAQVKAQLVRVVRATGVRSVVQEVSSDAPPNVTTTAKRDSAIFAHVLNFNAAYYYVRIEIDRAAANQSVRSIGVALERLVP